jgi:hypothetical protein
LKDINPFNYLDKNQQEIDDLDDIQFVQGAMLYTGHNIVSSLHPLLGCLQIQKLIEIDVDIQILELLTFAS